jgi:hypothetical protein
MNFGHFLLGAAEGLDYGVQAGDRIMEAMDNKRVRDAGKEAAKKIPQTGTIAPGSTPPATAPTQVAAPAPAVRSRPQKPSAAPPPAATIGVPQEQTAYDARFPAGIVGQYGVMGGPTQYSQYPYPQPEQF